MIINIFPDDPFNISNPVISNNRFLKRIPHFDIFCIWSYRIKKKLESKFRIKIIYLPFGYDSLNKRVHASYKKNKLQVNFIGTYDKNRLEILR